ncbi:MAG: laccase domain-containing protein [Spirochaetaceae bacterium]|nr:MAG: laccase domain-containing protein [Spirochaetaceae bacterium]
MIPLREEIPSPSLPELFRAGVVLRSQKTGHPSGFSISAAASLAPREARLGVRLFSAHLGVPPDSLRTLRQVHGTGILRRSRDEDGAAGPPVGDAHWTTDPDVVLLVYVADCCPVVLADPATGIYGVAHAGWRGTLGGIVPTLWKRLIEGGARQESIRGWIGPCAGPDRYEVGSEVATRFLPGHPGAVRDHPSGEGRYLLDIRSVLRSQLRSCGMAEATLSVSEADTIGDHRYHSHRRDGVRAGRMPAYVMRRDHRSRDHRNGR